MVWRMGSVSIVTTDRLSKKVMWGPVFKELDSGGFVVLIYTYAAVTAMRHLHWRYRTRLSMHGHWPASGICYSMHGATLGEGSSSFNVLIESDGDFMASVPGEELFFPCKLLCQRLISLKNFNCIWIQMTVSCSKVYLSYSDKGSVENSMIEWGSFFSFQLVAMWNSGSIAGRMAAGGNTWIGRPSHPGMHRFTD